MLVKGRNMNTGKNECCSVMGLKKCARLVTEPQSAGGVLQKKWWRCSRHVKVA